MPANDLKRNPFFQRRGFRLTLGVTALLCAGFLGFRFYLDFTKVVTVESALGFGTADAPYSDALGPWLHGSLTYYVHDVPVGYMYRPTIGLFFSTIISLTNSIAAVPVIWIVLFFVVCGCLFAIGGWSFRVMITGLLFLMAFYFGELVAPLNPETLAADFWPMVMGLSGVWFISLATSRGSSSASGVAIGFLLLGIAACVRGPQIASGGALFALLIPGWIKHRKWSSILILPVVFSMPLLIDSTIQKKNGIESNGIATLYCVYSDPTHQWTPESNSIYTKEKPSSGIVVTRYLDFIFSHQGVKVITENCAIVLGQFVELVTGFGFVGFLIMLATFSWTMRQDSWAGLTRAVAGAPTKTATLLGIGTTIVYLVISSGPNRTIALTVVITALGLVAFFTGRRLTTLLIAAFCAALLFHSALGLTGGGRVISSYGILLIAGMVAAATESRVDRYEHSRGMRMVAGALSIMVLVGYTGNFWLRRDFKSSLRGQLSHLQSAVKISNCPRLNRSLYYTGDGGLFYTHFDPTQFGLVRRYSSISFPAGGGNGSFIEPANVKWISPEVSQIQ